MSVMLSPARRPQTDGGHFEGRRSVDFAHFLSQASQAAGRQAGAIVLSWKIAMKCFCGREICELRRPCSRFQCSHSPPTPSSTTLHISLVCLQPPLGAFDIGRFNDMLLPSGRAGVASAFSLAAAAAERPNLSCQSDNGTTRAHFYTIFFLCSAQTPYQRSSHGTSSCG